jgi:HJR/Mrr/RecB family endonuclease
LDERNKYIVIDLIVGSNKRRITDEQRVEQERRLGISLLYQRKQVDFSSQSVISKITEIESQLVEYLAKHPELMREMNYDAFEKLVAELLASHGFDVEWTGRNNATAGDVIAFKTDSETDLTSSFIVECKRYAPDRPVGIEVARAIYGAKCDERFSNALLVTTSSFQRGVEQFSVRRWDFQLKDFKGLVEWLNRYRPKPDGRLHMDDSKRIWRSFE